MKWYLTLQRLGFFDLPWVGWRGSKGPYTHYFSVSCPFHFKLSLDELQPIFYTTYIEKMKIVQYFADVSKNQKKCEIKKCHHYQPIFTKIAIKTERKELRSWFCPYFFAFIVLFPVIYNTYSIDLFLEISKWWRHFDDVITRSCDPPPIFFFHTQIFPSYI